MWTAMLYMRTSLSLAFWSSVRVFGNNTSNVTYRSPFLLLWYSGMPSPLNFLISFGLVMPCELATKLSRFVADDKNHVDGWLSLPWCQFLPDGCQDAWWSSRNQPELAPAIAKCAQKKRHRKLWLEGIYSERVNASCMENYWIESLDM